ncbi:MAG: hypothetical protein QXN15_07970 [Candidatus Jordarchaeales archaeon]
MKVAERLEDDQLTINAPVLLSMFFMDKAYVFLEKVRGAGCPWG